jgi:hypothetical protein
VDHGLGNVGNGGVAMKTVVMCIVLTLVAMHKPVQKDINDIYSFMDSNIGRVIKK